jgi:hypothetical protein
LKNNQARQGRITRELSEIVGGAEVLAELQAERASGRQDVHLNGKGDERSWQQDM